MNEFDEEKLVEQLDSICRKFECQWSPKLRPEFEPFLRQVDDQYRSRLIQWLLEADVELRRNAQQPVEPTDYQQLGPDAVEVVRKFIDGGLINENRTNKQIAFAHPSPPLNSSNEMPQFIGRYRIERVLGEGGFGLVFKAYDDQLERHVAVKVPHANLVKRAEDAQVYLTEARTGANLEHSNIVPVYDVGQSDEFPCYVVSRYIEGMDLSDRIKQQPVSIGEAVELVATVAEALHHAHKHGVVHRDVKPGNILLANDGQPYVVDFGLALKEQKIGKRSEYAGTPAYMSPEQARGEGHRVDGRSDIYSLGVVLYELLVGSRTFTANSAAELLQKISGLDVKPPRQINDALPRELERICLKALCRRASDRYTTALDLADDLRYFLKGEATESLSQTSAQFPLSAAADSTKVGDDSKTPKFNSDSRAIRVVPKGLRSFDVHDADFFLELLPGPRDRDGLPDSIRFWKTKIEESDSDHTFSIGLIYGPSGCGKSSLVKAGLLPRLSDDVIAVYVEATPDETESRLLRGLRKACPRLVQELSLKDTLVAVRRGQAGQDGKKVVIVLDQFEQWLHAKKEEQNAELVQALRQCDGGHVQCVVLVRDDFWLAVSRFLHELEIPLVEGENSALADLFDLDHSGKVLAAFGRAFGKLPEIARETTDQAKQFLKQSIAGLSEEGKVICVRLALFAEMMKGKPWTPVSLAEVGGTSGVGVTFLEETFSTSTAPPEHRYHQKAARAVLTALLPDSGTDIKGEMKSYGELLQVSGYANRQKDFEDLVRILDSELRLITPTDPEGVQVDNDAKSGSFDAGQRYYQLTHDYLVPSLRDWLTSKQKETRRGRAELRLAERSALWNAKPENRRLPSWWENLSIHLFTDRKKWTKRQRKMMRHAIWIHSLRMMAGTVIVTSLALLIFAQTKKPLQIFQDPIQELVARQKAFDKLNLNEENVLAVIEKTFQGEDRHELIEYALKNNLGGKAKQIALSSEQANEGVLQLLKGIVERKPTADTESKSTGPLDEIRAEAFEIFCDLSTPSDVIEIIQSQIRDELNAPKTNESMRQYIRRLNPEPVTEQLAEIFTDQSESANGLAIATLEAWTKNIQADDLQEGLKSLPASSRRRFFKRMIDIVHRDPNEEIVRATVGFLDGLSASSLLDYLFEAAPGESKEAFKISLLPYANQTSLLRATEIGGEIENRLATAVRPNSDGELHYERPDKLEFLILGIGELGAVGEENRIESLRIISAILNEREQAEGDYLLDSVITSFAKLQLRQAGENTSALSTIRQVLEDSNADDRNRIAAAGALGMLADQTSLHLLLNIVKQKDNAHDLRSAAIDTLRSLSLDNRAAKSSVMPIVGNILSSTEDNQNVRKAALDYFGFLANPDEVGSIVPQLLSSDLESAATTALHRIMVNSGDNAGVVVEKLLPVLAEKNDEKSFQYSRSRVLVFTDFSNNFNRSAGAVNAAESLTVAFAKAAALGPESDAAERELAAKYLANISGTFQPQNPIEIRPHADETTRNQQLGKWLRWWHDHQEELKFTFD